MDSARWSVMGLLPSNGGFESLRVACTQSRLDDSTVEMAETVAKGTQNVSIPPA